MKNKRCYDIQQYPYFTQSCGRFRNLQCSKILSYAIEYYKCNPSIARLKVTLLLAGDQHVKDEGAPPTFMEIKLVC